MKKILKKFRVMSTCDNFPTRRHIHFLRIRAFASEGTNFTENESAHFDVCLRCRLKVIDALRNRSPRVVHIIMTKAA
jgi:hypothetical protein